MTNRLSIFCTWMATLMVLLSTVVMHHHHYERVCVAFELCQHGADDIEAELGKSHSHQESDRGSCRVHQLHKFIINASVAKNIRHHIIDGNSLIAAILPDVRTLRPTASIVAADWQHTASTLRLRTLKALSRRGPPVF